jgi:hypothetical protein
MTTPHEAMDVLDKRARELDEMSRALAQVERDLEPVGESYHDFIADFEIGLWKAHEEGAKLPSEALRKQMALKAMPPELRGQYIRLFGSRKRLEQRIRDIKAEVDAQRSILSALKLEMEAIS